MTPSSNGSPFGQAGKITIKSEKPINPSNRWLEYGLTAILTVYFTGLLYAFILRPFVRWVRIWS